MTQASKYSVSEETLTTYLVEDRRASISPWGKGNSKLDPNVFTYSKLPVHSCPGLTDCAQYCWALRVIKNKPVWELWTKNTERGPVLPPLPEEAQLVRFHVSGDFDSIEYIIAWVLQAQKRPDATFFGYTRSWRLPEMVPYLSDFNALPNVTVFASMDSSVNELPPSPFRRAWIEGDNRLSKINAKWYMGPEGRRALICPEEAGLLPSCEACSYCFSNRNDDLVFLKH